MKWGFDSIPEKNGTTFCRELTNTLASVNLPDAEKFLTVYPDELSGGMLQRVMIALTMQQASKLIIADEITTAVDAASEYLILNELEKIKTSGVSMLVITHDFGVVARLCDRVAVMKSGEIIEQGRTHEVLSTPRHDYTKQLMEASILFRRRYAKGRRNYKRNIKYRVEKKTCWKPCQAYLSSLPTTVSRPS